MRNRVLRHRSRCFLFECKLEIRKKRDMNEKVHDLLKAYLASRGPVDLLAVAQQEKLEPASRGNRLQG